MRKGRISSSPIQVSEQFLSPSEVPRLGARDDTFYQKRAIFKDVNSDTRDHGKNKAVMDMDDDVALHAPFGRRESATHEENRGLLNAVLYQRGLPSIERAGRGDNKTAAMPRKMSFHQMQFELDRRAHLEQLREEAARAAKETQRWVAPTTPVR